MHHMEAETHLGRTPQEKKLKEQLIEGLKNKVNRTATINKAFDI